MKFAKYSSQKYRSFPLRILKSTVFLLLLTRITNDVDNIQQVIVLFFQLIFPGPIICIAAVIMTYALSPQLIFVPILTIVIFVAVVAVLLYFATPHSKVIQNKIDRMMLVFREFFAGVRVIRAFDKQEDEKKKADTAFADYAEKMIRINKIFAWVTPTIWLLVGITMAVTLWVGGIHVSRGNMEIGSVTAIIEYTIITLMYLIVAAMVLVTIPKAITSVYRIQEVLEHKPEIEDRRGAENQLCGTKKTVVAFRNVSFSYSNAEEPVLQDVSFEARRGETTAIVGSTGSGKSTIAKVMLRFSDISSGSIRLNGVDIKKMTQHDVRDKISYVPQKSFLFRGTIEENIRHGNAKASRSEIKSAVKAAQAEEFIAVQPEGYQAFVAQGGTNFSGGQRQRLSIARALVKDADVYFFDDSFSALDYKTDSRLRQAIKTRLKQTAVIIVAQRISTIMSADQIIVINEGKVIGKGTHKQLL
ncbi:MAG: ABC transporter ATP-binding protein, partial [Lachnospiraceae bacterium]